jgi:hypothetical protein
MKSNNYIISLTTIPSKFDNLHLTIDSIINQTMLPLKIIVNIPKVYNFRMSSCMISEDKINDFLVKYSKWNCFVNKTNIDYGPGTKLLGLLESDIMTNVDPTNLYIILVDDDLIYKPYMIERFNAEIMKNKTETASFYVYPVHNIRIGQGADGFLIKYDTLHSFSKYYRIINKEDYLGYHDDFYISYYFHVLKKSIEYIAPPNNCLIYDTHLGAFVDALVNLNGKYARHNLNQKAYEILEKINNEGHFRVLSIT